MPKRSGLRRGFESAGIVAAPLEDRLAWASVQRAEDMRAGRERPPHAGSGAEGENLTFEIRPTESRQNVATVWAAVCMLAIVAIVLQLANGQGIAGFSRLPLGLFVAFVALPKFVRRAFARAKITLGPDGLVLERAMRRTRRIPLAKIAAVHALPSSRERREQEWTLGLVDDQGFHDTEIPMARDEALALADRLITRVESMRAGPYRGRVAAADASGPPLRVAHDPAQDAALASQVDDDDSPAVKRARPGRRSG
jgi:hypothetical protein